MRNKPQRGTDVRKMLLYKSNNEIAVKKKGGKSAVFFQILFLYVKPLMRLCVLYYVHVK